jgi:hypothetical protein
MAIIFDSVFPRRNEAAKGAWKKWRLSGSAHAVSASQDRGIQAFYLSIAENNGKFDAARLSVR